ncbi:MAG TPA: hypothetical protein VF905_02235 [Nitrospirota bacterium]
MSAAMYIFRLVWPFLKELVLGGLSLKEGMRTQKKKVFLLFFVSGLIFSFFLIIPRFYQLSQEHIKLEKSIEAVNVQRLEKKIKELEEAAKKTKPPIEVKCPEPPKAEPPPPEVQETKQPPKRQRPKPLPAAPEKKPEDKNDRKKAYMDFFNKYDE